MDAPRLDDLIELVRTRSSDDPLDQLQHAAELKSELDDLTDALLGHFVDQARRSGATWSQIGDALGVTKQAAQQKHTSTESTARRILTALAPKLSGGGFGGFRRFTARAKSVVVAAQQAAVGYGAPEIGTEHLLVALYAEPDSIAVKVLDELGADRDAIARAVLEAAPTESEPARGHVPFTKGAKKALELAFRVALELGHNYIGTEHILLALLRMERSDPAATILAAEGITLDAARERVLQHLAAG
jgi:hypothetical protein